MPAAKYSSNFDKNENDMLTLNDSFDFINIISTVIFIYFTLMYLHSN